MGNQVADAVDFTECLYALCARSWTVRLMQIVTVFPFIFREVNPDHGTKVRTAIV
jgi:hypothetical protein